MDMVIIERIQGGLERRGKVRGEEGERGRKRRERAEEV